MGMFDWYQPNGTLYCPVCKKELTEWQGKDGPNGLFVWKQWELGPIDQRASEDCKLSPADLARWRLPAKFEIYSYDCPDHFPVVARCRTAKDGAWSETDVSQIADDR